VTNTVIVISVILGGPGYLIAAVMVLGLRIWFGNRVTVAPRAKWIRIVLNALLLLLATLAALYGLTFVNAVLPPGQERQLITRGVIAVVLSIVPYFVVLPLGGWWLGVGRSGPADITVALYPRVIPDKEA
jgi:hypothetical protein